METSMISQELKEMLEGMARVFHTKLEETLSSRTVVPASESVQLEGTRNYPSWSGRALLDLQIQGLEKYAKEECTEPENKAGAEWSTWSTNSLVVSWLLASVSPTIAGMVESIYSAADVWKTLAGMYSGAGSVVMMMEVEEQIDAITQGEKTVLQNPTDVLYSRTRQMFFLGSSTLSTGVWLVFSRA